MAFGQKQEVKQIDQLDEEKIQRERLAFLGTQVASLEEVLERTEEIRQSLLSLEIEKQNISEGIHGLEKEESRLLKKVDKLSSEHDKTESKIPPLNEKIETASVKLAELKEEIEKKKTEKTELSSALKAMQVEQQEWDNRGLSIQSSNLGKEYKAKELDDNLKKLNEELSGLSDSKKELVTTLAKLEQVKAELIQLHKATKEAISQKNYLITSALEIEDAAREQAKNLVSGAQGSLQRRSEQLDVREGDISRREGFLEDKRKKLSIAKLRLEQHFGKTIKDIII